MTPPLVTAIAKRLSDRLPQLTIEQAYSGVDHGKKGVDFTVALPRFRLPGKPDELAKRVLEDFQPDDFVASITHDKQFLHFQLTSASLIRHVLNQIHTLTYDSPSGKPCYGTNTTGAGKKLVIEYSSPNVAKSSFHVGHLRSTIIGAFLANLYRTCCWVVVSMNYRLRHTAAGFEKYGSKRQLSQDPIKHLYDVYVKVSKDADTDPNVKVEAARIFKRMEDGDESVLANWREWRELSILKYIEEYDRLNVSFDRYTGESEVGKEWMDTAVERLDQLGLISDANGAKLVDLEKWKPGKAVLRKAGTSQFWILARLPDIRMLRRNINLSHSRHCWRNRTMEKYRFDKIIYVVASPQDLHLAQFFQILKLMDFAWAGRLEQHPKRHRRFLGPDNQGNSIRDARADEAE
ncbi:hypothetical protein JVT61DRAFT_7010 [Boletus reticuloceps]|uniref:Arginyl-tRNA synthetase catalytic core domain-containing protein n=1 Tax=Boletus reticuloceps TaxID=495285 RepID=A0A8I2YIL1_9AGAM|nr:hypothetical protein JVT61DRAFT_7010 [Boletus reticuloceps]